MPRSDEAEAFFLCVCIAVQEIPYGKVTTYGHIGKLVGTPQRARQVGICMKHLPQNADARFNHENVPWQRVINQKGTISPSPLGHAIKLLLCEQRGLRLRLAPLGSSW
ncbi:6-O-methylguanine DNA methyltransferase [Whalleya microplaca]|nr:6-O-methylguanine DNA methyltransferase [Whalleya microplaca]